MAATLIVNRPATTLAALLLAAMPAGLDVVECQTDEWASGGAVAQLHRVKVQVAPGRLDELALLARQLEGRMIGAATILEADMEDRGAGVADVFALATD